MPTPQGRLRLPVAGYQSAKMLADETTGDANFMLGPEWGVRPDTENGHAHEQNGAGNGHE